MRGFGFRTVPNYPPEREWLVMTAILVLTLLISSIVLAAAAAAIEPDIRLVIAGVAWWFAGVTIEGVRRHYARARGVSFVDDWDYARIYFR